MSEPIEKRSSASETPARIVKDNADAFAYARYVAECRAVGAEPNPNYPASSPDDKENRAIEILREVKGGIPPWLNEYKIIDRFLNSLAQPAQGGIPYVATVKFDDETRIERGVIHGTLDKENRTTIIEECAKVAESMEEQFSDARRDPHRITVAIRALKNAAPQETGREQSRAVGVPKGSSDAAPAASAPDIDDKRTREDALAEALQLILDDWANANAIGDDAMEQAERALDTPLSATRTTILEEAAAICDAVAAATKCKPVCQPCESHCGIEPAACAASIRRLARGEKPLFGRSDRRDET